MPQALTFRLYAPLASFGEVAVGEQRPSADHPGKGLVLGLVAAALGIRRSDEAALAALHAGYGLAVLQLAPGTLLRDYHTAQTVSASDLKKAARATRRDELRAVPRADLHTILSERDYRQDAQHVVALWVRAAAPFTLDQIAMALREPVFGLYLGRRSCPLALPLVPKVFDATSLRDAFAQEQVTMAAHWADVAGDHWASNRQRQVLRERLDGTAGGWLFWEDGFNSGLNGIPDTYLRHDAPLHRERWQFAARREYRSTWPAETAGDAA